VRRPKLRIWHGVAFILMVYVAIALSIYTLGWHAGRASVNDDLVVEILDAVP